MRVVFGMSSCIVWLALLAGGGVASAAPTSMDVVATPTAVIHDKRLDELSGVTPASRPGEYWAHNDHGNKPALYRFTDRGAILQRVVLEDVKNVDWEAMTRDADGNLYIADVGDNDRERKKYRIHKLPEPAPRVDAVDEVETVVVRYPGKTSVDCEAFFLLGGKAYLIKKDRSGEAPAVYGLGVLKGGESITARAIGTLRLTGAVTSAAYSRERGELAVLTRAAIFFLHVKRESDLFSAPFHRTAIDFGQAEALCYAGDELLVTNEPGTLWKYPVEFYLDRESLTSP